MPKVAFAENPFQAEHDIARHPERPARVAAIRECLEQTGLLERMQRLSSRAVTSDELELVHTGEHIGLLRELAQAGGGRIDADTSMAPGSFNAALHAAGALLAAVDSVLAGPAQADAAFSLIRPPGHHATAGQAMGFCLFNNVAIAARYAQRRHGLQRVAIVDFDVHHGNGTQEIYWNDPSVLYLSLHQYPHYPGSGHWRETGGPDAPHATVNVPLLAGCGDAEYLQAFDLLLLPLLERFEPELLLVSAGYDAHAADPLADMEVSAAGYGAIMARLRGVAAAVCGGRMVMALEGGYDLEALAASVEACVRVLLDDQPSVTPAGPAQPRVEEYLHELRRLHGLEDVR
jgi:acetoin utilization deacetylase AcuC-like enzyme